MSQPPPEGELTTRISVDRERIVRTLTFWLRPAFVLRVLNRFQLIAGFDRAMALASSALTALIPLAVLAGALLPHVRAEGVAQWLIDRYALTGGGAEAVKDDARALDGDEHRHRRDRRNLAGDRGAQLRPRRAAVVRAHVGAAAS